MRDIKIEKFFMIDPAQKPVHTPYCGGAVNVIIPINKYPFP
jgi:hypothetical protein